MIEKLDKIALQTGKVLAVLFFISGWAILSSDSEGLSGKPNIQYWIVSFFTSGFTLWTVLFMIGIASKTIENIEWAMVVNLGLFVTFGLTVPWIHEGSSILKYPLFRGQEILMLILAIGVFIVYRKPPAKVED